MSTLTISDGKGDWYQIGESPLVRFSYSRPTWPGLGLSTTAESVIDFPHTVEMKITNMEWDFTALDDLGAIMLTHPAWQPTAMALYLARLLPRRVHSL